MVSLRELFPLSSRPGGSDSTVRSSAKGWDPVTGASLFLCAVSPRSIFNTLHNRSRHTEHEDIARDAFGLALTLTYLCHSFAIVEHNMAVAAAPPSLKTIHSMIPAKIKYNTLVNLNYFWATTTSFSLTLLLRRVTKDAGRLAAECRRLISQSVAVSTTQFRFIELLDLDRLPIDY